MAVVAGLRGCAEAALAIAALVSFGLMWAGIESLGWADDAQGPAALERPQDWSTQVADLSWAGDASIQPHLVDFPSEPSSR
jgi:hypothetical protein